MHDQVLSQAYPHLFSYAKKKDISLQKAYETHDLPQLFHLPLPQQAFSQLLLLATELEAINLLDEADIWTDMWGNGFFSSSKTYRHLSGHRQVHKVFNWLWKSKCQNKHKVFFWLVLKDRLSTRNILKRKHMILPSYSCVSCHHDKEETLFHLIPFSARVLDQSRSVHGFAAGAL